MDTENQWAQCTPFIGFPLLWSIRPKLRLRCHVHRSFVLLGWFVSIHSAAVLVVCAQTRQSEHTHVHSCIYGDRTLLWACRVGREQLERTHTPSTYRLSAKFVCMRWMHFRRFPFRVMIRPIPGIIPHWNIAFNTVEPTLYECIEEACLSYARQYTHTQTQMYSNVKMYTYKHSIR